MENELGQLPTWINGPITQSSNLNNPTPSATYTPSAEPTQNNSKGSGVQAGGNNGGYVDPVAWTNVMNQVRTKLETNNKLTAAKNALSKGMYDQPLTDQEKEALTPAAQYAMQSGNRSMLDTVIKGINDQIKGYNDTIDTNLSAYTTAVNDSNNYKQNINDHVATMLSNGTDPNAIAGYLSGASGGTIDPSEFGLNASINIPAGTLASANNNPGNLKYVGQPGATEGQDGFAMFSSSQAGFQALQQQITLDATRGETLEQYITKYAPPTENDTALYIQQAMQYLGVSANTPLSQINTAKLAEFQAQKESGSTVTWSQTNSIATTGTVSPVVQAYVDGLKNGTITSISSVPAAYKSSVAVAMQQQGVTSPLADSRFTMASNRIVSNYIQLPAYQLTANGLPYLQRIAAAEANPGSISDQDLLDSLTKLNTSGNAISDAQVSLITGGKSFSDSIGVWMNKLNTGGVLSDDQRQEIAKIANAIYANYAKGYQPVYNQVTSQLKDAGIPSQYWTIPDLNSLAKESGMEIPGVTDVNIDNSSDSNNSNSSNLSDLDFGLDGGKSNSPTKSNFVWYNPLTW